MQVLLKSKGVSDQRKAQLDYSATLLEVLGDLDGLAGKCYAGSNFSVVSHNGDLTHYRGTVQVRKMSRKKMKKLSPCPYVYVP